MFGQYYIKNGIIPLEYGKLYSQLQTMREESDYNCSYEATAEDIARKIEPTRLLIEIITRMVS